jgi:hypothetical protein
MFLKNIWKKTARKENNAMELMECVHPFKINGNCKKNIRNNSL